MQDNRPLRWLYLFMVRVRTSCPGCFQAPMHEEMPPTLDNSDDRSPGWRSVVRGLTFRRWNYRVAFELLARAASGSRLFERGSTASAFSTDQFSGAGRRLGATRCRGVADPEHGPASTHRAMSRNVGSRNWRQSRASGPGRCPGAADVCVWCLRQLNRIARASAAALS